MALGAWGTVTLESTTSVLGVLIYDEDPSYKGMYLDSEIETGTGANKDFIQQKYSVKMYQDILGTST